MNDHGHDDRMSMTPTPAAAGAAGEDRPTDTETQTGEDQGSRTAETQMRDGPVAAEVGGEAEAEAKVETEKQMQMQDPDAAPAAAAGVGSVAPVSVPVSVPAVPAVPVPAVPVPEAGNPAVQEQDKGDSGATSGTGSGEEDSRNTTAVAGASESVLSAIKSDELADESALQHLNVDYSDDADSALGDMTPQSSTISVRSSIYNYVEENGRTYHRYKEGKYYLPNDEMEMDRLDLQHQLWLITLFDELYISPIKNPQNILDIGTGTGIWAIEAAHRYPSARVVGSDLSPIQPSYVPPNCQFEVDDAEDDWNYTQQFDLVHGRMLNTCFKDFSHIAHSAYDALVPGGYMEMQDFMMPLRAVDDTMIGTSLERWSTMIIRSARALGLDWQKSAQYARQMEEAGFEDVQERHLQWPNNRWPKDPHMKKVGLYWQEDFSNGLEAISMAIFSRAGLMTHEEILVLIAATRNDINNKNIHAYLPMIVVTGRKPGGPPAEESAQTTTI